GGDQFLGQLECFVQTGERFFIVGFIGQLALGDNGADYERRPGVQDDNAFLRGRRGADFIVLFLYFIAGGSCGIVFTTSPQQTSQRNAVLAGGLIHGGIHLDCLAVELLGLGPVAQLFLQQANNVRRLGGQLLVLAGALGIGTDRLLRRFRHLRAFAAN